MDITANYKSGIFLGIGILFFVFSILIVDSDGNLFERKFDVYTWVDDSQGIAVGSLVSLSGLTAGSVSELTFDKEKKRVQLTLSIKKRFQEKIPKDSRVDIRTQGALGDKFIFITPGDFASGLIEEGSFFESDPQGGILEVLARRGTEAEKFFDVLVELQKFTKNLNDQNIPGELRKLSEDTRKTLQKLQGVSQEFQTKTLAPLSSTAQKLDSVIDKIDRGQGTLGKLVNDPSIFDQAKKFMGGRSSQNYFERALSESVK